MNNETDDKFVALNANELFQLIVSLEDGPVRYQWKKKHLQMTHVNFPLSIMPAEAELLYTCVYRLGQKHKSPVKGFEVATAFGVSMLPPAYAMAELARQENNYMGSLITMDSYVEEKNNDPEIYKNIKHTIVDEVGKGYESAVYLRDNLGLKNYIDITKGWSPEDVPAAMMMHFTPGEKLNYVFLDGGHFPDQIKKDFDAIWQFVDKDRYVFTFHDVYPWSFTDDVVAYIKNETGKDINLLLTPEQGGENLGGITSEE